MRRGIFIAVGSNLGDARAHLARAIRSFEGPRTRVLRVARAYRSAAVGPGSQPRYLNTVFEAETSYAPLPLLDWLKSIEHSMGRTAGVRWGPRVIDLDIALFSDERVVHPRLEVPHRELANRAFVLRPLAELEPSLRVPGTSHNVTELLDRLGPLQGLVELAEDAGSILGDGRRREGCHESRD